MDNFLDTCIILAAFDKRDTFHKKSKEFTDKNDNLIISIYQEKKELTFLFFRKEKILIESIKSSAMPSYNPNISDLTKKDQIILKKTLAKLKLEELSQQDLFNFKRDLILFKQRVFNFIGNKISRKVVPLNEIDNQLVEKLKNKINNIADCNIIASAIQEHQRNHLIIITNDLQDIKKEYLVEASQGSKYNKLPEIKNIL